MKGFNFNTLSTAIGIVCLVASVGLTASAQYIQGQPTGCGSDHCTPPPNNQPYCWSDCPTTTNPVQGTKRCCLTLNGAYGPIKRLVDIYYLDEFCGTDCDKNGRYIYTSCRYEWQRQEPTSISC